MSWSRGLLLGIPLLASCGFQPLYADRGGATAADQLAAVRIEPLPNRSGQELYNALRDGLNPLGRPASPDHLPRTPLEETS